MNKHLFRVIGVDPLPGGCPPGEEVWQRYNVARYPSVSAARRRAIEYNYRAPDGRLFTCTASSLKQARRRRDAWLEEEA